MPNCSFRNFGIQWHIGSISPFIFKYGSISIRIDNFGQLPCTGLYTCFPATIICKGRSFPTPSRGHICRNTGRRKLYCFLIVAKTILYTITHRQGKSGIHPSQSCYFKFKIHFRFYLNLNIWIIFTINNPIIFMVEIKTSSNAIKIKNELIWSLISISTTKLICRIPIGF
ncbi:hypothetical protein D3C81_830530 [compost metagenome]